MQFEGVHCPALETFLFYRDHKFIFPFMWVEMRLNYIFNTALKHYSHNYSQLFKKLLLK